VNREEDFWKRCTVNKALPSFLLPILFLAGCSSAPAPEDPPPGIHTEVTILSGGFVRFADERVPLEAFLLAMRYQVREAGEDPTQLPWVQIDVDPAVNHLTAQAMVQRLMDGLSASGIRNVSLEGS
jgi:hypothetical protein